jgi:hypothetical protein
MNKSKFFTGQPIFTQIVKFLQRSIILKASKEYSADLRKFLENPDRCRIINSPPNLNAQLTLNLSG